MVNGQWSTSFGWWLRVKEQIIMKLPTDIYDSGKHLITQA